MNEHLFPDRWLIEVRKEYLHEAVQLARAVKFLPRLIERREFIELVTTLFRQKVANPVTFPVVLGQIQLTQDPAQWGIAFACDTSSPNHWALVNLLLFCAIDPLRPIADHGWYPFRFEIGVLDVAGLEVVCE